MADKGQQPTPVAQVEEAKPEKKARQLVSAEEFIRSWPLMVVAQVEDFSAPEQLNHECPGTCARETTWGKTYDPKNLNGPNPTDEKIYTVGYVCMLCQKATMSIVYRYQEYEKRTVPVKGVINMGSNPVPSTPATKQVSCLTGVLKIGQYPAPSVKLPRGLQDALGSEAAKLYRKALENRNHGYGLGAAVYMRRVVEDKTNELIEVAAQLAESHNADADTVKKMRDAASSAAYTPYEEKLKIASTVFPESLKVGSLNPLKVLFGLVSKGIHGLSEAECIGIADQTKEVFEYIFTNLRAQVSDQKSFLEKVKNLA